MTNSAIICAKHHICPHINKEKKYYCIKISIFSFKNACNIYNDVYFCDKIRENVIYKEYTFKERMIRSIKQNESNNS